MDKQLRDKLEACRPASDDLLADELSDVARVVQNDPQARLIHERLAQWDAALSRSMDDVAVPPGLAERILGRLEAGQPDHGANLPGVLLSGGLAAALDEPGAPAGETQVAPPRPRAWSRRHWAGAAAAALVAGVLVIAVGNWLSQGSQQDLDVLADEWREQLGPKWQEIARAPDDFAAPPALLVAPHRWQWVNQFSAVPVVAYELAHAKAGQAMLYVARMSRAGLPSAPPLSPQSNTAGRAVAWWQTGGRVYVLVVNDERSYRAFVRPTDAPLT
jgi:hypothetical protein